MQGLLLSCLHALFRPHAAICCQRQNGQASSIKITRGTKLGSIVQSNAKHKWATGSMWVEAAIQGPAPLVTVEKQNHGPGQMADQWRTSEFGDFSGE